MMTAASARGRVAAALVFSIAVGSSSPSLSPSSTGTLRRKGEGKGVRGASASASGGGLGRIMFIDRPDNITDHVFIMNADGSNSSRLTTKNVWAEGYPTWSPDGTRICFEGYSDGVGVYVINSDGTGMRRLSPIPGMDVRPSWSPDGSLIVYTRVLSTPAPGSIPPTSIMTMSSQDGSGATTLLPADPAGTVFNIEPRWAPDGSAIVFMSNRDGGQQIYSMKPDGSGVTQLTNNASAGDPFWSPDSKRISFGSNREGGGKLNVFLMDADGGNVVQVTNIEPPWEAGDTSFSPDGTQIAFECDLNGHGQSDPNVYAEVRVINVDGSGMRSTGRECSSVGCAPRWAPGAGG
jgi:Tol biopolymer transport system component